MRRGTGTGAPRTRREWKPRTEFVIGSETDLAYAQQTRQRLRRQAQRRWILRLAILAALGLLIYQWGDDVWFALKFRAATNLQRFRESAEYLKRSRDERSGANFDENAPDQTPPTPPASDME